MRKLGGSSVKNIDTFLVLIQNKNMNTERRKFMKGMVSASLISGVLIMPGGHYLLQNKTETEQPPQTSESNAFQLNYDFASISAAGMAATGLFSTAPTSILNNARINCNNSFLTLGLPTMEYLLYPVQSRQ